MGRKTLVATISEESGYAKWEVKGILTIFFSYILRRLRNGDTFTVPGFGTFCFKIKKERIWTHPISKEKRKLPGRVEIVFKVTPKFTLDEGVAAKLINDKE